MGVKKTGGNGAWLDGRPFVRPWIHFTPQIWIRKPREQTLRHAG
jgi:hypothetical protein